MPKHRMKVAFHVQTKNTGKEVATASSSGTAEWVSHAASDAAFAFLSQFTSDPREFRATVHFLEVEEVDVSTYGSGKTTVSGSNIHEQQAEATGSAQFVADIVSGAASTYEVLHPVDTGPEDSPEANEEGCDCGGCEEAW